MRLVAVKVFVRIHCIESLFVNPGPEPCSWISCVCFVVTANG
jgi:hypothetical protein